MVGAVIGVRQAIKNKNFDEMNHLSEGYLYSTNIENPPTDFVVNTFTDLGLDEKLQYSPFGFGSLNYTIVGSGENPRFKALKASVEKHIVEPLKGIIQLQFTENIETEDDLFEWIRGNSYQRDEKSDSLLFAISVPPDGYYNFTIYQSANFPNFVPETRFFDVTPKPNFDNFKMYAKNGFVSLQVFLANYVLEESGSGASIESFITAGQTKKFVRDDFMDNIGPTLALFILLIFIAPQYRFISFITLEKASRAREGMKMMGLNDAPYWVSWFIYYFCVCLTISIV